MQFDYERLTPDRFQEFCQALLVSKYPGTRTFPVGQKDGGRDAVARTPDGEQVVYQVKFKRDRLTNDNPYKLLTDAIKTELPKISALAKRGATRYVIMTNIAGTSALDAGSMDKVDAFLAESIELPSSVIWRTDLDALLQSSYDLRWAYSELLTSGDMLRHLVEEGLGENSKKRMLALSAYLAVQYELDETVKFKQADLQASDLLSLFIDVPAADTRLKATKPGNHDIRRTIMQASRWSGAGNARAHQYPPAVGGGTLLLSPSGQRDLKRLVIEGAPGQGKSTLAQYVCQIQRMKILDKESALASVPEAFKRTPSRIPFKVDLRDLSTWLRHENPFPELAELVGGVRTLETFLATQVTALSGGQEFSVGDLNLLLNRMPALVFLDGLDEVATTADRRAVIEAVTATGSRLQTNSPDTQLVVTSRPAATASTPRFSALSWDYVTLISIDEELIYEYAERWSSARRLNRTDRLEVQRILKSKLSSSHIADLARNAMQLTILLNLVHARGAALPDQRTELYDKYIDVFFNRESEKDVTVRDNRDVLLGIHGYLAWRIHGLAESRRSSGRVTEAQLKKYMSDYLQSRAYSTEIVDALFAGVVQRIVALVSRVEGTFEFEVQPLREYFAAKHLYNTAPYSPAGSPQHGTKPEILQAILDRPYWLNVTRFYAGCYSVGELLGLEDAVNDVFDRRPSGLTSFPRTIGAALLQDRVFAQAPKIQARFISKLLDARTLRYGILGRFVGGGGSVELDLPRGAGQTELLTYAIKRGLSFERGQATESAMALSSIPRPLLSAEWIKNMPSEALFERDGRAWLRFGSATGVLRNLDDGLAESIAEKSVENWQILVSGGHAAALRTPEQRSEAVRLGLDGKLYLSNTSDELQVLGSLLERSRFSEPGLPHLPETPPARDDAVGHLVERVRDLHDRHMSGNVLDRSFWEDLASLLEADLGTTWGAWVLAIRASLRPEYNPPSADRVPDFIDPLAVVARSHHASRQFSWYADLAEACETPLQRRIWLALLYCIASPSVIDRSSARSQEYLEGLDSSEYRQLHTLVSISSARRSPRTSRQKAPTTTASTRHRFLLLARMPNISEASASSHYQTGDFERDPALAAIYLQELTSGLKVADSEAAAIEVLAQIRRVYKYCDDVFAGLWFDGNRNQLRGITPAVAEGILLECDDFPMAVVAMADGAISNAAAPVTSVASQARRERWAAN